MDVYHYHPKTGEYLGRSKARLDPLESKARGKEVYLLPRRATFEAAPEPGANEAARMRPDGTWETVPDHRGTKYWRADGTEILIRDLGETVPQDALTGPPPEPPLTQDEIYEQKIQEEILAMSRATAIQSLKDQGELPPEYDDRAQRR